MSGISAIGIKAIYYGVALSAVAKPFVDGDNTSGLSPAELKAFLAAATTKQITNVHGETWKYEKTKPTKTYYKNQLTGKNYRGSVTDTGASKISFSIGKYDFETKADIEGGTGGADKYSAASQYKEKSLTLVGLTEDGVYIVYPKADIIAGTVTTDNALAIEVEATAMEPDIAIESEAQIRKSAVDAVA